MKKRHLTKFIIFSFISVLITRLLPHPPNFTSAIALSFYLPALFGYKCIIVAISAFVISDFILGIHNLIFFTWSSIVLVGLLSRYFSNYYLRIIGIFLSCFIFYLFSNFGVWLVSDLYSNDIDGLIKCYFMGLPFFQNTLMSSIVISVIIELFISMSFAKNYIEKINSIT